MGRYTAVARTDKWMRRFGIDVEEIDQGELVRRSGLVPAAQAVAEGDWLEKNAADIHYDGKKLVFSGRRCGGPSSSPLRAMSPWRASPVWTVPTGCRVTKACFEPYNDEKNESSMHQSTYMWPDPFTRTDATSEAFPSRFGANHIHAGPGDVTGELAAVCRFLEIDLERLDV